MDLPAIAALRPGCLGGTTRRPRRAPHFAGTAGPPLLKGRLRCLCRPSPGTRWIGARGDPGRAVYRSNSKPSAKTGKTATRHRQCGVLLMVATRRFRIVRGGMEL